MVSKFVSVILARVKAPKIVHLSFRRLSPWPSKLPLKPHQSNLKSPRDSVLVLLHSLSDRCIINPQIEIQSGTLVPAREKSESSLRCQFKVQTKFLMTKLGDFVPLLLLPIRFLVAAGECRRNCQSFREKMVSLHLVYVRSDIL